MMTKRTLSIVAIMMVIALVAACGANRSQVPAAGEPIMQLQSSGLTANEVDLVPTQDEFSASRAVGAITTTGSVGGGSGGNLPADGSIGLQPQEQQTDIDSVLEGRVILKNASLSITVEDAEVTIESIVTLAESMGGWVVSSNTYLTTNRAGEEVTSGRVTVRVPADRLTEAMNTIKTGAGTVNSENISGHDVTQEYVDISSRLRNLEASEEQLLIILGRAETVEETLAVQHELTNVRSEIEQIQGRLNYFNEAAAFSLLDVTVQPVQPTIVQSQSAGWSLSDTVDGALGTLVRLGQGLVDILITLVIVGIPALLILGIPARLIWRRLRRGQPQQTTSG